MTTTKTLNIIGTMSGTSLDGIDVALISTDGYVISKIHKPFFKEYPEALRQKIEILFQNLGHPAEMLKISNDITLLHAKAIHKLLTLNNQTEKSIDLIGFHGQTIYHNAKEKISLQLGNPQLLAKITGIPVISNLRDNDIVNGGEGAPIVPIYHQAILNKAELPIAIINIGGVANITAIFKDKLIAGDVGPGNALLDDWMKNRLNKNYDENGTISSMGEANKEFVGLYIEQHKFFNQKFPKSLDRNDFFEFYNNIKHFTTEDGAATLTFLTAASIAKALKHLPKKITKIVLSGGGRKNLFLHKLLKEEFGLEPINIDQFLFNDLNLNGDFIEAESMAFIAARSFYKLPYTFPGTTGVEKPVSGGAIYLPS